MASLIFWIVPSVRIWNMAGVWRMLYWLCGLASLWGLGSCYLLLWNRIAVVSESKEESREKKKALSSRARNLGMETINNFAFLFLLSEDCEVLKRARAKKMASHQPRPVMTSLRYLRFISEKVLELINLFTGYLSIECQLRLLRGAVGNCASLFFWKSWFWSVLAHIVVTKHSSASKSMRVKDSIPGHHFAPGFIMSVKEQVWAK